MNILKYVKEAFLFRWHLLVFAPTVALSLMSGYAGGLLPIVFGMESLYLLALCSNKRFQKAVDAQGTKEVGILNELQSKLEESDWERIIHLQEKCLEISNNGYSASVDDLNKLFWTFVRLNKAAIDLMSFLQTTRNSSLENELSSAKRQLADAKKQEKSERLIQSIDDKIATLQQRVDNRKRANENLEIICVNMDQIEQKINAIGEMAMTNCSFDEIGKDIKGIVSSVEETQKSLSEMKILDTLLDNSFAAGQPEMLSVNLRSMRE